MSKGSSGFTIAGRVDIYHSTSKAFFLSKSERYLSVSYTHLDVYKRQDYLDKLIGMRVFRARIGKGDKVNRDFVLVSVSYTHLDVYKRQRKRKGYAP